jgi:hypothetical protein
LWQREDDELLLKRIALRCAGTSATEIARQTGGFPQSIYNLTNRVREADLRESGERRAVVLTAYWP